MSGVGLAWLLGATALGIQAAPAPTLKQQFEALLLEYQAAEVAWNQKYGAGQLADPQAQLIARYRDWPGWKYAPRFVQLAEEGGQDQAASDALVWVSGLAPQVGTGDIELVPAYRRAFELLAQGNRLEDRRVIEACRQAFRYPSPWTEEYLRTAIAQSGNREVRGLACLFLARLLESRRISAVDPWFEREGLTPFQSFLRLRQDPAFVAYLKTTDPKAVEEESEQTLERVIREFGDVVVNDLRPRAGKQTLAELARAELNDLRKPDLGKPALDIGGMDATGKPLKLSDHRGRVVVLVFFPDWDEDCRKLYAPLRRLAEQHKDRPFSLLGVDCDKDPGRLHEAVGKNEISWRCWLDGLNGQIAKSWGIVRLPTIVVLDPTGVIRFKDFQKERVETTVKRLLSEIEEKRRQN
jgi:peroxiredoxin